MLQSLRIRNLALLEEVALDFEAGFTAVTGETGAGKSILLGALSLLAGERADKTIIRQGADTCEVEASLYFANPKGMDALLAKLDLPSCEEGLLILKRSLSREKAPKITVNASLATLSALQQIGESWIDFHGPSEPRRLLKDSCQLELLDLFGRCATQLATYQYHYRKWVDLIEEHKRISSGTKLSPAQLDYLQTQIVRLDALELADESIGALERDFQIMSQAQALIEISGRMAEGLSGEEGAQSKLAAVLREARHLQVLDSASSELVDRLTSISVEMNDLAGEVTSLAEQLQFDPEKAAQLQNNMDAWLEMKRKHGGDLVAVIKARDEMRHQLEVQGDIEGTLLRLEKQIADAYRLAKNEAKSLSDQRGKASKNLAKIAAKMIAQLGFEKSEFLIRVVPDSALGPMGDCGVEFMFSPNVGEAPLPLNRIASSGELARVMLALKTVLADLDQVPLLVFDEVDANVGGEIGNVVGQKMAEIARGHQVLCVTHLPQVASQATCHLVVDKDQSKTRAVVTIVPIQANRKTRISELARMLGDRTGKSAMAHAEKLLGKSG
jgi:DNA repair protein RecN (Recombination protein N)